MNTQTVTPNPTLAVIEIGGCGDAEANREYGEHNALTFMCPICHRTSPDAIGVASGQSPEGGWFSVDFRCGGCKHEWQIHYGLEPCGNLILAKVPESATVRQHYARQFMAWAARNAPITARPAPLPPIPRIRGRRMRVFAAGKAYPSLAAAGRGLGIPALTLNNARHRALKAGSAKIEVAGFPAIHVLGAL